MGQSISIQRKLKRDLFRIARNLVYVWENSEKMWGLYTLYGASELELIKKMALLLETGVTL